MSRHFRPWTIDQTHLLPAAVVDYVPADHLARFVVALAREHLDVSEIVASYKSGLGHGPGTLLRRPLPLRRQAGPLASQRVLRDARQGEELLMPVPDDEARLERRKDFSRPCWTRFRDLAR
jgi:hypothetical protein